MTFLAILKLILLNSFIKAVNKAACFLFTRLYLVNISKQKKLFAITWGNTVLHPPCALVSAQVVPITHWSLVVVSDGCVPRARLGHSAWKSCCNDATGQGGCRMGCARLCEACGLQFGHAWPKLIKQAPCIAEMLCTVFMWEFWAGGMNGSLEISAFQLSSSKAYIAILNLKSCLTFRWEKSDEMNCVWIHTKIASTQYEIKTS